MTKLNSLNPAAGEVPIPEDPREVAAALRAGLISYRLFPYLEWRYSGRGKKFTRSDSAWLVWLTRFDQKKVDEQILWLRRVLSNRGMPSCILEAHLRVLSKQLTRRIPEQREAYVLLRNCADQLGQLAEANIPEQPAKRLIAGFSAALGRRASQFSSGVARLLVAALADEKSGIKNAVPSLTCWLTDVPRLRAIKGIRARLGGAESAWFDSVSFEARWRKAIEATIDQARLA